MGEKGIRRVSYVYHMGGDGGFGLIRGAGAASQPAFIPVVLANDIERWTRRATPFFIALFEIRRFFQINIREIIIKKNYSVIMSQYFAQSSSRFYRNFTQEIIHGSQISQDSIETTTTSSTRLDLDCQPFYFVLRAAVHPPREAGGGGERQHEHDDNLCWS